MAKKRTRGAEMPMPMKMKEPPPSVRMDLPSGRMLPKRGDKVRCEFSGTVIGVEDRIDKYGDRKPHKSVEIEHDPKSIRITSGKAGADIDAMSDEAKARMKKEHPDKWREYLGGPK